MDVEKARVLFNELLEKYRDVTEDYIWEKSSKIDKDLTELRKEIEDYKTKMSELL